MLLAFEISLQYFPLQVFEQTDRAKQSYRLPHNNSRWSPNASIPIAK